MMPVLFITLLQLEDAGTVQLVIRALGILFAFLTQILIFHDIPNQLSITGFVIVAICIIVIGIRKVIDMKSGHGNLRSVLCLPKAEIEDVK